jgi:LysM repeat protein
LQSDRGGRNMVNASKGAAMSRPLAAALCLALAGAITAAGSPGRGGCGDSYTVVRGDTLTRIARRCGSSVARIAAASRLANPNRIEVGQRLVIPGGRAQAAAAPEPGKVAPAAGGASSGLTYRIAPTDTLYSLARWARVSLAALMRANPGMDPRAIEIGDSVRLPAGAVEPDAARSREGRPGSVYRPAPPPPPRASAPEPRRDEEEIKPEDEDEREPMGM